MMLRRVRARIRVLRRGWRRPARSLLTPAAVLALSIACLAWRGNSHPAANKEREIASTLIAHIFNDPHYAPYVDPGRFTWTERAITARPLSPEGVTIYDYGRVACVDNGCGLPELPDIRPLQLIRVRPDTAEAVTWRPDLRQLFLARGPLCEVQSFGSVRTVEIGPQSCVITQGDAYSSDFTGCTALAIYNGEWLIFAHCLSGTDPTHGLNVANIVPQIEEILAEKGGEWKACIAGPWPALQTLTSALRGIQVPVVQRVILGDEGYTVFFSRRTERLSVAPVNLLGS